MIEGSPSNHPPQFSRKGFTLVELLAVIVVIFLLMLAGAPLLSDSSTNGRQASREMFRAHLQQARSHAIASGRATAVIIAGHNASSPRNGGLLTVAELESQPTEATPFKASQLVQRWSTLPESMFFLDNTVTQSPRKTLMDSPGIVTAEYQKQSVTCHAVVFSPDGRITHPTDGSFLAISIGRGKDTPSGIISTQKSGSMAVFDFLQINRLNARSRLIDPRATP